MEVYNMPLLLICEWLDGFGLFQHFFIIAFSSQLWNMDYFKCGTSFFILVIDFGYIQTGLFCSFIWYSMGKRKHMEHYGNIHVQFTYSFGYWRLVYSCLLMAPTCAWSTDWGELFILIMRITIHTGLKISVTKGVKDRMNLIPLLTNAVTPALRIC